MDLMIPNEAELSAFDVFKLHTYLSVESILERFANLIFDNILNGRNILSTIFMANLGLQSRIWRQIVGAKFNRVFNIYGPQHVKFVRQCMYVVLCVLHVGGAISFYKLTSLPTADYISVYAFKTRTRLGITKLCVDPPAWFLVTLILVQLAVAACIPKFQEPVSQAMPNILPTVVAMPASLYLIEYIRRAAFLRHLVSAIDDENKLIVQ